MNFFGSLPSSVYECESNCLISEVSSFLVNNEESLVFENTMDVQDFIRSDNGSAITCEKRGVRSSYCENLVDQNRSFMVFCDGAMSNDFDCSNNRNAACFCYYGEVNTRREIISNKLFISAFEIVDFNYTVSIASSHVIEEDLMRSVLLENSSYPTRVDEDDNEICVYMNYEGEKQVVLLKGSYNYDQTTLGYSHCIRKTNGMRIVSGNLTILVSVETGLIFREVIFIKARDNCQNFPGIWNLDMWRVKDCWSGWYTFLWTFFWISFLIFVVATLFITIKCCISCTSAFSSSKARSDMRKLINKMTCGCYNYFFSPRVILLFCLLTVCHGQCVSSLFSSSTSADCIVDRVSGLESCTFNEIFNFEIPFAMGSVCLNLVNDQDELMETITVELLSVRASRISEERYITSDYDHAQQSHQSCFATQFGDDDSCEDANKGLAGRSNYGLLGGIAVDNPGRSGCLTSSSAGCFFNTAYTYWAYSMVPKSLSIEAVRLGQISLSAIVEICIDSLCSSGELVTSQFTEIGGIDLTFDGFLNGGNTISMAPDDDYITSFQNRLSVGPASPKNYPEAGKLGDIQAETSQDLRDGNFIYAPDTLLAFTSAGNEVSLTFEESGYSRAATLNSQKPLPYSYNGNVWRWDTSDRKLKSNITQSVPALFTMSLPRDFIVTRTISEVCPDIKEVGHMMGCYNCTDCSDFQVEAKSTCSEGGAILSCDGLTINNPILAIGSEYKVFNVSACSNERINNFQCSLSSPNGDHVSDFHVSGVLDNVTLSQSNTTTYVSDDNNEGDCEGDFFQKVIDGCGSFWDWTLTIAIFSVSGIVLILLLLCILYICYMCAAARLSSYLLNLMKPTDIQAKKDKLMRRARNNNLTEKDWDTASEYGWINELEITLDNNS